MASIGRVSATLGISLVATLFALPASHAAKCTSWNIGNQPPGLQWGVRQSNGYIVGFVFRQQGTTLRGTAQYWLVGEGNKRTDGTINGTIKGKVISFAVRWSNGAVGDYSARSMTTGPSRVALSTRGGEPPTGSVTSRRRLPAYWRYSLGPARAPGSEDLADRKARHSSGACKAPSPLPTL